jgi:TolB-like protein
MNSLTKILVGVLVLTTSLRADELGATLESVSTGLITSLKTSESKTVAVLSFSNLDGQTSLLGRFLAEELTVTLTSKSSESGFSVVDRHNLERILAELKLSSSGLADPENAKKVGKLANLDAMIVGTLVDLGSSYRWTSKLIETQTAKIIGATAVSLGATEEIRTLWSTSSGGPSTTPPSSGGAVAAPTDPKLKATEYPVINNPPVELLISKVIRSNNDVTIQATLQNRSTSRVSVYAGNPNPYTFYSAGNAPHYQQLGGYLIGNNGDRFRLLEVTGMQLVDKAKDPAAYFKGTNYFLTLEGSGTAPLVIEFGARGSDQFSSDDPPITVSGILEARIVSKEHGVSSQSFSFPDIPFTNVR